VTEDNRLKNIAIETARGDDSLESARILLAAGKYADSVSRAYYGTFHYARALPLSNGEEAQTHRDLTRRLHRDFVRAGKLDPDIARLFSRLQSSQKDADYSAEIVFTLNAAVEELAAAEQFIQAAREILAQARP
jgi:uncharacterized protein (UPF0332 family)